MLTILAVLRSEMNCKKAGLSVFMVVKMWYHPLLQKAKWLHGIICLTNGHVMPGFHHSVAVSPFCRCKIPLFCKNYVSKFRSVTAVNSKNIRNGSGNGNGNNIRKRLTGTAK